MVFGLFEVTRGSIERKRACGTWYMSVRWMVTLGSSVRGRVAFVYQCKMRMVTRLERERAEGMWH